MKSSDIKGLPVEPVGPGRQAHISDLILDIEQRNVLALQLDWSGVDVPYAVAVGDVQNVTDSGVLLAPQATILPLADLPQFMPNPTLNRLLGENVLSESGQVLGTLQDVEIDLESWTISAYSVLRNVTAALEQGLDDFPAARVLTGAESLTIRGS